MTATRRDALKLAAGAALVATLPIAVASNGLLPGVRKILAALADYIDKTPPGFIATWAPGKRRTTNSMFAYLQDTGFRGIDGDEVMYMPAEVAAQIRSALEGGSYA